MLVIALDPGNSTGYCFRIINDKDENVVKGLEPGKLYGGTQPDNHKRVWDLLEMLVPDVIVYETFQMYPGKAQKLIWNSFYPVEVIGVIKLWAMLHPECKLVGLQPSVKKFALANSELELWKTVNIVDGTGKATEHTRDAVRLLRYYERNYKK